MIELEDDNDVLEAWKLLERETLELEMIEFEEEEVVGAWVLLENAVELRELELDNEEVVGAWMLLESAAELRELELNSEEVVGAWVLLERMPLKLENSRVELDNWVLLTSTTEL